MKFGQAQGVQLVSRQVQEPLGVNTGIKYYLALV